MAASPRSGSSRWRTWVRRIARWAGLLLLVFVLLVAGVLVLLHTDTGRELVRARAEKELGALFVGKVRIGGIEGSLLSEFSVVDVEIEDANGSPAITLGRIDIDYSPTKLIDKTVQIESVSLESLEVHARAEADGTFNLAILLKTEDDDDSEESEGPSEPSAWSVNIPAIHLSKARVDYDDGMAQGVIQDLAALAALRLEEGELVATLTSLEGRVLPPRAPSAEAAPVSQLPLSLEGTFRTSSAVTAIENVKLALGLASADVATLLVAASGETKTRATLDVPADAIRSVAPSSPLLANVHLELSGSRADDTTPIVIDVEGHASASPIDGTISVAPETGSLALKLAAMQVHTESLWMGVVPSNLDLTVDAKSQGLSLETLDAEATVKLAGTVDKVNLGALELVATVDRGVATLGVSTSEEPKWIDASARIKLDPLFIETSELSLAQPKIQTLLWGYSDARGDLELAATASGSLDDLTAKGSLSSRKLSMQDNRLRGLSMKWNAHAKDGRLAGSLVAKVKGVFAGTTNVGSVKLDVKTQTENHFDVHVSNTGPRRAHFVDARADVEITPEATTIDIDALELAIRGLEWRGKGGRVAIEQDGDLAFAGVALTSSAGRVQLDGHLGLQEGLSSGDVEVVAKNVDLADLGAALAPKAGLRGIASLRSTLHKPKGGRVRASLKLAMTKVAAGGDVPATSGTIALELRHRNLDAMATLDADGVGSVELEAKARGPLDPLAIDRWQRLGTRTLVSASVRTSPLELERLSRLSPAMPRSGSVRLEGALGNRGRTGTLSLLANDVIHEKTREPAQSEVRLVLDDRDVTLESRASIGNRATMTASALALLPGSLLDPRTARATNRNAVRQGSLHVDVDDLLWWDRTLELGLEPENSRADLDVQIGPGIKDATVTINALQRGEDAFGNAQDRISKLVAKLGPDSIDVKLRGALDEEEIASGTIRLDDGWDTLLFGDPAQIANSKVSANLAVHGFPLAIIPSLVSPGAVPVAELPKGRLLASAQVEGTLANPKVDARAHTEGAIVTGIEFVELETIASYADHRVAATLRGSQRAGGSLDVRSETSLGASPTTKTTFEARDWDLGFLKHLIPERSISGLLSANARVDGGIDAPRIFGEAHIKKGSVHPGAPLYAMRDLDIELALGPDKLTFVGTGSSGRGDLALDGTVVLANLVPSSLRLDIELDGMPFEAGPLSVYIDTNTTVRGKIKGSDWRFDVDVGETVINVPGERSHQLHPDTLPSDIVFVDSIHAAPPAIAEAIATTPATVIDVYIKAPETISVRGEPVRTVVDIDLHARIDNDLLLEGTVATRGGWIELFGRRYDLQRGDIGFGGTVDPALDIELSHEFSAMTLIVGVSGTGTEPELLLRSDPARYDDAELLSLVLGASPDDDPTDGQTAAGKATGVASNYLVGQLQSVVSDVIPIDVLKIDLADDEAAAEQLTVGNWITDKILLAYRRRFEAENLENANEALIEYRFRRRWLLEFSYGDQGTGGADVLWIRRF